MNIDEAITLLKKVVKNNGTNNMKHIDLGLVPADERSIYENALAVVKLAIFEGKLTQDEFSSRIELNH